MTAARPTYARLDRSAQSALLRTILARCVHGTGTPPVVIFDLDGTLIDNRPRTCAILREIAAQWQTTEPELAARLLTATPDRVPYHFRDTLAVYGITREDLVTQASDYWKTHFFADPHIQHDVEVAGAARFARECYAAGASIVYLTGRDLPQMGLGTFGSLRSLDFPIGVCGTELVLKPDPKMLDFEFKRFEAPKLARVGRVVASFDNEPENCNIFLAQFPDADSVLVDTQHAAGAPPLSAGVKVIPDFVLG
jgi:phosphoglycolate phosphatase-like HAD superfamily hydrolase